MLLKKNKLFTQKGLYALFCVFVSLFSFSQSFINLVNNPSAEQYTACPFSGAQAYKATYWYLPTGYNGSTDYYNTCSTSTLSQVPVNWAGSQNPRTGNSYFGFVTYGDHQVPSIDYREYLGNGLKQTMKNGKKYCVTYYVSLAELSRYASANIGVIFTKDSLLNRIPSYPAQSLILTADYENTNIITDTINWVPIQGIYSANGIERFITLGNFRIDATTNNIQVKPLNIPEKAAYYYIDDISVIEINNANAAVKDSIIKCKTDSIILGTDSTEFAIYQWQSTAAGLAALSCTNCPNPIAKPLVTTKYYLTKQQCSSTTKDSVTVVVLTPTTQANAGNDKTICVGDWVQIGTQDSLMFTNYSWKNGATLNCINCAMPFANPNVTTTYTLQRTECSTISTDTVKIIIDDCDPTFVLPNVFTPNGDDINDTWGINFSTVNSHLTNFKMSIYDRWGLLVFETNPDVSLPKAKWDGATTAGIACNNGVYFYVITFNKNNEPQKLTGHLSLFR